MFYVDTLFVISSKQGNYQLDDLLSAINWTCTGGPHFTVIVDETGCLTKQSVADRYQVLHTDLPEETPSGFHRAAGLKWAIDQGITYRQVIMLADTCLIMTKTLDAFFLGHTQTDGIGVIGVRSQDAAETAWRLAQNLLFEWNLPVSGWERAPVSLCDDVLVMAGRFVGLLYQRRLLVPEGCSRWPGTYGSYLSWASHLLGMYVVSWGFETKSLPPLYVNPRGVSLPPPHLLGQKFLLYSPVNRVLSYSEADLREMYKQQRGETAREVQRLQPVVTGPDNRDVT